MAPFNPRIFCAVVLIISAGFALRADRAGATQAQPTLPASAKAQSLQASVRLAQAKLKPLHDREVNLLGPDQGGQALIVPNDNWLRVISGDEKLSVDVARGQSAVFAFKDERPATFWKFSVLIPGEDSYSVKQIEILAGRDSPTGQFDSVAKLDVLNAKMIKFPYQEVSFADTTAKYVMIKILDGYGGGIVLRQIRLLGSPVQ